MNGQKRESPVIVFRQRLVSRRQELVHALEGTGVPVDRFIRAATTAMQTSPDLAECTFESVWQALLKACRDQLLPDGVQGAIVPYKRTAQWIPMYRGLLNRFERSGQYKWVTAGLRRSDDLQWRVWIDEHGQHFMHEPGPGDGKIIETYAAATTLNGGFFVSVVTEKEMARIRAVSKAKREDSPWAMWEDEMRKKTALRRLAKILPLPQGVEELMSRQRDDDSDDDLDESGGSIAPPSVTPPQRPRGAQQALEQFAQDQDREEPLGPTGPVGPHGDEQDNFLPPSGDTSAAKRVDDKGAGSGGAASGQTSETRARGPAANAAEIDAIKKAYRRGQDDHKAGKRNDAMPEEYQTNDRNKEQQAWAAGFDGDPMPNLQQR